MIRRPSHYIRGVDLLGADTIPSVSPDSGYTDSATVLAVQMALQAKGFSPGSLDGIMGPKTAAAIKRMQSSAGIPQTGVIDYGVLSALGVSAGASSAPARRSSSSSSSSGGYASIVPAAAGAPSQLVDQGFWQQPLWDGSPVRRWQGAFGLVAGISLAAGLVAAMRR